MWWQQMNHPQCTIIFAMGSKTISLYKKIIQIGLIIAGLAVIIFVYINISSEEKGYSDPLNALPGNVSLVLEVKNFDTYSTYRSFLEKAANHKNELAGISFNPMGEWPAILNAIDSLRTRSLEWQTALSHSSVLISCTEQGRADAWILTIGLRMGSASSDAEKLMSAWAKHAGNRDFKGVKIHSFAQWQYAVVKDCLVITRTASLMEDVIIHDEKNEVLRLDQNFSAIRELVSADVPIHFYFKINETNWLQLDPSFSKNKNVTGSDVATLSGFCAPDPASHHTFSVTGDGRKMKIHEALPANTAILDVLLYPDFESGWRIQDDFHQGTNAGKFWSRAWQDFGDSCQCDLNEALLSWRSGEWGNAVIAVNDSTTSTLAFFGMQDSIDAIAKLRPLLMEQDARTDGIYQLRYPQLLERNQQQSILVETNYITQVNEFVFVAGKRSDLVHIMKVTNTLGQTENFKKGHSHASKNTGRYIYQNAYYSSPLPTLLINMLGGFEYISTHVEVLKENKFLVSIDVPFENKHATTTQSLSEETPEPKTVEIGNTLKGPWTVVNHSTKEKEQVLQNEKKEICLLNKNGDILWSKPLDSEILGEVLQIDALKNGKLQIAFTTQSGLHIMDRNGNELKGFPILPKPSITSPLHVADYDNNKKYRLLFCAGDDMIFNYSVDATKTEGWKYQKKGIITWIDDFKIGSEDYIMTVSAIGSMEFLKRTGDVRYKTEVVLTDYNGGKCEFSPATKIEETKITYTTKSGEKKTVLVGK